MEACLLDLRHQTMDDENGLGTRPLHARLAKRGIATPTEPSTFTNRIYAVLSTACIQISIGQSSGTQDSPGSTVPNVCQVIWDPDLPR